MTTGSRTCRHRWCLLRGRQRWPGSRRYGRPEAPATLRTRSRLRVRRWDSSLDKRQKAAARRTISQRQRPHRQRNTTEQLVWTKHNNILQTFYKPEREFEELSLQTTQKPTLENLQAWSIYMISALRNGFFQNSINKIYKDSHMI